MTFFSADFLQLTPCSLVLFVSFWRLKFRLLLNSTLFKILTCIYWPVPVAARSKASVCGRLPAEIVVSNPTGGMDVCLL